MADNGDDASETGRDTGGFVFGEERTTDDEGGTTAGGLTLGIVAAAVLLVVIVAVIVLAAIVQPFGMNSGETGDTAPDIAGATTTVGTTSGMDSTETGTPGEPATTDSMTPSQQTDVSPTPPSPTATQTAQPEPPTPTQTPTQATPTATPATTETATPAGEDGTESTTATPGERSPVIESFAVTDRSGGSAATFDVAWNVSDPNRDLVAVEVSLVADPDGETRIIERRRFDAGGAQTTGSTTFEVAGGASEAYEVRIEVVDGSGNTAFSLTRAVADGSPDE